MNKTDFSKLGFNSYQCVDLQIILSLRSKADMAEWMEAVGPEDVDYGINLLKTAAELQAWHDVDDATSTMTEFPEALSIINGVK